MNQKLKVAAILADVLLLAAGTGAWYMLRGRPAAFCQIDGRPIHAPMRTLVEVNGKRIYTCCPRCPLTLESQTGAKVRLVEVTDYITGRQIPASQAYFVDGSDVEICSTPRARPQGEQLPYERMFDRCAPSLIAFADEGQTRAFMAQHGGVLRRLGELEHEVKPAGPGVKTP